MHTLFLTIYQNNPASLVYIVMRKVIQSRETTLKEKGGTEELEAFYVLEK